MRSVATVLLSGGVDSVACMKFLQSQGFEVRALFIDYGQPAATLELRAATALAKHHLCPLRIVRVTSDSHFGSGELLGRNAFLIFTALFFLGATPGVLALGLHSGTNYYDCSEAFFDLANKMVTEHTNGALLLVAPFLTWTKKDVFRYFCEAGLSLSETYSCESGDPMGCGSCLSCHDRKGLNAS
jgi:7-cyano-7-deazaguanine synthase